MIKTYHYNKHAKSTHLISLNEAVDPIQTKNIGIMLTCCYCLTFEIKLLPNYDELRHQILVNYLNIFYCSFFYNNFADDIGKSTKKFNGSSYHTKKF